MKRGGKVKVPAVSGCYDYWLLGGAPGGGWVDGSAQLNEDRKKKYGSDLWKHKFLASELAFKKLPHLT